MLLQALVVCFNAGVLQIEVARDPTELGDVHVAAALVKNGHLALRKCARRVYHETLAAVLKGRVEIQDIPRQSVRQGVLPHAHAEVGVAKPRARLFRVCHGPEDQLCVQVVYEAFGKLALDGRRSRSK